MSTEAALHAGGPTGDSLFDYVAGRLHPEAATWLETHLAECVSCRGTVEHINRTLKSVELADEGPFREQRNMNEVKRRIQGQRKRSWAQRFAIPAVATSLLAASLILYRQSKEATADELWSRMVFADREASVKGSGQSVEVPRGERVAGSWGKSRIVVSGAATGANARLISAGRKQHRLALTMGRVALAVEPLPSGTTLSVSTPEAIVTVTGTRFLVEHRDDGTRVAVQEGSVRVERGPNQIVLQAGTQLFPGMLEPMPITDDLRRALERMEDEPPASAQEPSQATRPEPLELKGLDLSKPGDPHDPLYEPRKLVLDGKYESALMILRGLVARSNPAQLRLRAQLLEGHALRLAGRPAEAIERLRPVAKGSGTEAQQALVLIAETYGLNLDKSARAAGAWKSYLKLYPSGIFTEEARFRLGESLLKARKTRGGIAALSDYLKKSPTAGHRDEARLLMASARRDQLRDCGGALLDFEAVRSGTFAPIARIGEARCLVRLRRMDSARASYARYLELAPNGEFASEARAHLSQARDQ